MAKPNAPRPRRPAAGSPPPERRLRVGRPLQARLIALEKRVGLFSEEQSFAADSRFNHPVILPPAVPVPDGMGRLFADDLAELERTGRSGARCHRAELGPYAIFCLGYFHYDGFRALLYVEQEGVFVAAWAEQEALQPDSPRTFVAGVDDGEIEAFLTHIPVG